MKKIKILIAEDHKLIRETWHTFLKDDSRLDVIAACGDTEEALILSQLHCPDIVLMDINILPLNGFLATAKLAQISPNTRVIGLSFHSEMVFVQKMFTAGAKGYVTKNSECDELIEAIIKVHMGKTYVCSEIREKGFEVVSSSKVEELSISLLEDREM
jgi:DNA-binding NarL/FixJ family response regulator